MTHLSYFDDKDKAEIEKELKRLCQIRYERNKEFEAANRKRNIITIVGFASLFFALICVIGKPEGINILWSLVLSIIGSFLYYFVNFSVFISWLGSKGIEENNRLVSLDRDIAYLEKLYDSKEK